MAKTINVQQHVLVPKHVLMTEEEVMQLLTRYNISKKQMPSISSKDPAIKNLNVTAGNVIKVICTSLTQGKAEFYRAVRE